MYKVNDFYNSSKRLILFKKIITILIYIIIIPIIIINLTLMTKSIINPNETPSFFGVKSFVIISKSMEDTIMTGDAIIVKEIGENELKLNDIISFKEGESVNTHRIVGISNETGKIEYTTKGDNNKAEDKEKVTYNQIEGKYLFRIKKFGKIVEIMKNKITLVILLSILIIISFYEIKLNKRKLERKEKRYKYNEKI